MYSSFSFSTSSNYLAGFQRRAKYVYTSEIFHLNCHGLNFFSSEKVYNFQVNCFQEESHYCLNLI